MFETITKPSIFLGSSRESRGVMNIFTLGLKEYATAVPWTDEEVFPPGYFILNSLLNRVTMFDFAVFFFGPDDIVESRDQKFFAPRDNVVFELGLFMSQLTLARTFVVVPRSHDGKKIKILSDLSGLKLYEYNSPKDINDLPQVLNPTIENIGERICELKQRKEDNSISHGAKDVLKVGQLVEELAIKIAKNSKKFTIKNIALDMEFTWGFIHRNFIENPQMKGITWKSLMIDPEAEIIKNMTSHTVSVREAALKRQKIEEFGHRSKKIMKDRNISFECRAYNFIPVIHGFMIDDNTLLMSLCSVNQGKLVGDPNYYLRFDRSDGFSASTHYFNVFNGWFDYLWDNSKKVWPKK